MNDGLKLPLSTLLFVVHFILYISFFLRATYTISFKKHPTALYHYQTTSITTQKLLETIHNTQETR
jgi:hypothetical protein